MFVVNNITIKNCGLYSMHFCDLLKTAQIRKRNFIQQNKCRSVTTVALSSILFAFWHVALPLESVTNFVWLHHFWRFTAVLSLWLLAG